MRLIRGSYRLRSSDTNNATNITPAAEADLDADITSTIEKLRTEAAIKINPAQVIVVCHELFRELGIWVLRRTGGERGPPG